MRHRATDTDSQLTVFIRHVDVAQVEAKQAQEALEIRSQVFAEPGVKEEPGFIFTNLQVSQIFQFITHFGDQVSQILLGAHY
ncbi:hypothetical protein D3C81_2232740 [compost metagenome]